jgi:hypothetical protein
MDARVVLAMAGFLVDIGAGRLRRILALGAPAAAVVTSKRGRGFGGRRVITDASDEEPPETSNVPAQVMMLIAQNRDLLLGYGETRVVGVLNELKEMEVPAFFCESGETPGHMHMRRLAQVACCFEINDVSKDRVASMRAVIPELIAVLDGMPFAGWGHIRAEIICALRGLLAYMTQGPGDWDGAVA